MKPSTVLMAHYPLSMTTILHCPHLPNPIYYLPKLLCSVFMSPLFILLYPLSAKWVTRDNNIIYPLETSFPEINLTNNPRNPTKVAVCDGCKSNSNNRVCLPLTQIPQCIHNVPYAKRKYLSPIYLHTSLGRSAGTNPFVECHHLLVKWGILKIEELLYSTLE